MVKTVNKHFGFGLLLLSCAALLSSGAVEARENRMAKCNIRAARAGETPPGPALVANVPNSLTPIDLNAVLMTDKNARKNVVVEGLFARRTEMNTLEVVARFFNCTKQPIALQVRSNFMDAAQIPTEQASVWKTVFLSPRATAIYQEKSISSNNVSAYLVELRTAD